MKFDILIHTEASTHDGQVHSFEIEAETSVSAVFEAVQKVQLADTERLSIIFIKEK